MPLRTMSTKDRYDGTYRSTFDPATGTLVRVVDSRSTFSKPRSPSPETVDISITNYCVVGCAYCYQDSTAKDGHGRKDLVEKTLKGFDTLPYQIAIGGGEPTLHPDFIEILHTAKGLGTVPNYTTSGIYLPDEILKATNETCGGVALTYHAFKGPEYFIKAYSRLRDNLKVQINVHLIADASLAQTLPFLIEQQKTLGKMRVVLLAYYPDVGRATLTTALTKQMYMKQLPGLIEQAAASGMSLAFSEGLLPFFLSRPELPVNTMFATRAEGLYSCYVHHDGRMSRSSFDRERWARPIRRLGSMENDEETPTEEPAIGPTIFDVKAQALWASLYDNGGARGEACYDCPKQSKCAHPSIFHYALCKHASHNRS